MFADINHALPLPVAGRFNQLFWRLANVFQPAASGRLPAELQRLPDHLLHDIGVERADLPPVLDELVTRADMLESRSAMTTWLSATTR